MRFGIKRVFVIVKFYEVNCGNPILNEDLVSNKFLIIRNNKMSKVEIIKENSNYLRGTLEKSLSNNITGAVADDDQVIIKFHGSYQQDDRDRRSERAEKKLEKLYSFMLRLRIAGGKINAKQWLGIDEIAKNYANEVIKITTRQTVQLHGIIKSNLKPTIATFSEFGIDSISACGDVNRNVMASTTIAKNKAYDEVYEFSKKISDNFLPESRAYHEIWLDGEKISQDDVNNKESFYQKHYLPRKFKIVIAIPPSNDVDVYAHDIGLIAIIENENLIGFNIAVGGGMGRTHGNENTFARIADLVGFIEKDKIINAIYHIMAIQRDFGERLDRSLSRFKYTIHKYGIEWFKAEFAKRFGEDFKKSYDFKLDERGDNYGFHQDYLGHYHFVTFVENGRVFGNLKNALREIANEDLANFRFSNNQNIIISDIKKSFKARVSEILEKNKITNNYSPIKLDAIACVALNTCSLALAEGQRYLPSLIAKIEPLLVKHKLEKLPLSIRMTGCPNGCGRPYLAEIGLVGRSLGKYDLHIGGDGFGNRLNQLYKEQLSEDEILSELNSLFLLYAKGRQENEYFGDFIFNQILTK